MNPGTYREPVEIQKAVVSEDDICNKTAAWIPYCKCRAYVNNLSGEEYWAAVQVKQEKTVVFTVRYHKSIADMDTTGYRIVWNGGNYDIKSIDDVQNRHKIIKIRAERKG